MTSSEDINFSKYSIITEQNNSLSTDLEIIDQNKSNQGKTPLELSQILISDPQIEEKNDKKSNISIPLQNQELSQSNEKINQNSVHNLLYGNPIDIINPKYIGKSYAFLYDFKGDPKITIGPHCKIIFF